MRRNGKNLLALILTLSLILICGGEFNLPVRAAENVWDAQDEDSLPASGTKYYPANGDSFLITPFVGNYSKVVVSASSTEELGNFIYNSSNPCRITVSNNKLYVGQDGSASTNEYLLSNISFMQVYLSSLGGGGQIQIILRLRTEGDVTSFSLNPSAGPYAVGDTVSLNPTFNNDAASERKTVNYELSGVTGVVKDGVINADGTFEIAHNGTVTITATATNNTSEYIDDIQATPVTITVGSAVTGITVTPTSLKMNVNESKDIDWTVTPNDACEDVDITYSDESILYPTHNAEVRALKAGKATIYVTATNGTDDTGDDIQATISVTVIDPNAPESSDNNTSGDTGNTSDSTDTGNNASDSTDTGNNASNSTDTGNNASNSTDTGNNASNNTDTGNNASNSSDTGNNASNNTDTGNTSNSTDSGNNTSEASTDTSNPATEAGQQQSDLGQQILWAETILRNENNTPTSYTHNNNGVLAFSPEGYLPAGGLISYGAPSESEYAVADPSVANLVRYGNKMIMNLNLSDSSGTEVHQLGGFIQTAVPLPFAVSPGHTIAVYRIDLESSRVIPLYSYITDDALVFYTDHFSTYAFVEDDNPAAADPTLKSASTNVVAAPGTPNAPKTLDINDPSFYFFILLMIMGVGTMWLYKKDF
ncbi:MAG: Ig-like domain-containing protein [Lachnospiraceae bacterium]|nr:Ig-like domain-containing protein [Lachnospiraceae bacterium]